MSKTCLVLLGGLLLATSIAAVPAAAQTPARPAPTSLWGELEAIDSNPLPPSRDTTAFNDFRDRFDANPWFMSVDVANGWLVTGLAHGIQVWDVRNVSTPQDVKKLNGPTGTGSYIELITRAVGEVKWPGEDISLPPGNDDLAAYVGKDQIGLSIWDLSVKTDPNLLYQQPASGSFEVYAANLGGRAYAFLPGSRGLMMYDMSKAQEYDRCLDNLDGFGCPGVQLGRVGDLESQAYVDGQDHYVAVSGAVRGGVEIWALSTTNPSPATAKLRLSGLQGKPVFGIALFREGGKYYLSAVTEEFLPGIGSRRIGHVFDVDCIDQAGCGSVGAPLWSKELTNGGGQSFVTFSRSGDTPFLYFGTDNRTGGGPQREQVVMFKQRVTGGLEIRDISPQATDPNLPTDSMGNPTTYWSWYYEGNPTGFQDAGPRRAVFWGQFLYRAAWSIMDVHQRAGGVEPTVQFNWTSDEIDGNVYAGPDPSVVSFVDQSSGSPNAWSWIFEGGSPSTSSAENPTGITFATSGAKTITLTAFNNVGPGIGNEELTVLDPKPVIGGVSTNVTTVQQCQPITFTADGVTGQPELTYGWEIRQNTNVIPQVSTASTLEWAASPGQSGDFFASLKVNNVAGEAVAASAPVTVTELQPLPAAGFQLPAPEIKFGQVKFDATAVSGGATEWTWDFGDGTVEILTDPVEGPAPTHIYSEAGTYEVTLSVTNCTQPQGSSIVSAPITVVIEQATELRAGFELASGLQRLGNTAFATVNQTLRFDDLSTGAEVWDYDWNGDGTFEDAGNTAPVTEHVYNTIGKFQPRVRVSRGDGAEVSEPFALPFFIEVTQATGGGGDPDPTAILSVNGPTTGQVNSDVTFSASAFNCDPLSSGWSWSTSRGEIVSAAATTNRISIRWNTTGSKVVQVTNSSSSCAGVVGRKTVTITDPDNQGGGNDPGGGGGSLKAAFSFSPGSPQTGAAVRFDASGSSGSPETYIWDFGDGSKSTTAKSAVTNHTFGKPGTYTVKLEVARTGTGPGCFDNLKLCIAETTRQVTVGGTAPKPEPTEALTVCPDDPDAVCLLDDRFKVQVAFNRDGSDGIGKPMPLDPLPKQDTTGFLWFFNPNSVDLIVKMIRGNNDHFWFFYGGLSDAEFTISVTDQDTGETATYHNDFGNICGDADIQAFPVVFTSEEEGSVVLRGGRFGSSNSITSLTGATHNLGGGGEDDSGGDDSGGDDGGGDDGGNLPNTPTSGACQGDLETLCLLDGRYEVTVDWLNHREPTNQGTGRAIQGTDQTGYFWFFSPSNVELVVKMIDGTTLNEHVWVFYGALSDVEYHLKVRDTVTGDEKMFNNEGGNICGRGDTEAF